MSSEWSTCCSACGSLLCTRNEGCPTCATCGKRGHLNCSAAADDHWASRVRSKLSEAARAVQEKAAGAAEAVQEKATDASQAAALTALGTALEVLDRAVKAVRNKKPGYEITLEISAGPVSLSVTVPASDDDDEDEDKCEAHEPFLRDDGTLSRHCQWCGYRI